MKKIVIVSAVLALVVAGIVFGSSTPEPSAKAANVQTEKLAVEILFFMNPNGMPCKMQEDVFRKAGKSIAEVAEVVRVKTSVGSDRRTFYEYGIRSLPAMIILKDGKVAHRFIPGIRTQEEIMQAISKVRG